MKKFSVFVNGIIQDKNAGMGVEGFFRGRGYLSHLLGACLSTRLSVCLFLTLTPSAPRSTSSKKFVDTDSRASLYDDKS